MSSNYLPSLDAHLEHIKHSVTRTSFQIMSSVSVQAKPNMENEGMDLSCRRVPGGAMRSTRLRVTDNIVATSNDALAKTMPTIVVVPRKQRIHGQRERY